MGRLFIISGIIIFLIGIFLTMMDGRFNWFGNIYGDYKIIKSNYKIFFPLSSMIVLSVFLTLFANIIIRIFK